MSHQTHPAAAWNLWLFVAVGLTVLLPALAHASILPANVVDVDFNTTAVQDNAPNPNTSITPSGTYSGTGAAALGGVFWNGEVLGAKDSKMTKTFHTFSSGPLLASDGATTTAITVSLGNISQYDTTSGSPPNSKLLSDYAFADNNATGTFTIAGLDGGPATYDLYIYSQNGTFSSGITTFTIGTTSHTVTNTGGSEASFTSGASAANYVVFTGLTGGASHQITGTFISTNNSGGGPFNGFQLVETVTPEPASLGLLACGSLLLLRRRK